MKNKHAFNINDPQTWPRWKGEYADQIPKPYVPKRGPNRIKPRKKRK